MVNFNQFPDSNFGWAGVDRDILERALSDAPSHLTGDLHIAGSGPTVDNMMLFRITRKVLGKDTENYAQQIGSCVSFGMKNAVEYLQCSQIAMGNFSTFHQIFTCYIYGTSRMIGHMLNGPDGSVGIFACQAVNEYGVIARDLEGVPKYSKLVDSEWGRNKRAFEPFFPKGKEHLVKKTAKVSNWDELVAAVTNLYPVTLASNVGYTMKPQSDGFHHRSDPWEHQMVVIGIDNGDSAKNIEPHACILNSWGDIMGGPIQDFRDPDLTWPVGTIRARKKDVVAALSQDDSWAISSLESFEEQKLPDDYFIMG